METKWKKREEEEQPQLIDICLVIRQERATDDVSLSIQLILLFVFGWIGFFSLLLLLLLLRSICGWQIDKVLGKCYKVLHRLPARMKGDKNHNRTKTMPFRWLSFTFHTEFTFIAIVFTL